MFTIPVRIKGYIQELEMGGKPLDFHKRFKDELEDIEDRNSVLQRLAKLNPKLVGGIVDVEKGVIYRVGGYWRRVASYILIPATAAMGLVAIYFLSSKLGKNFNNFALKGDFFNVYLIPYLLTIVGVTGHIIKEATAFSLINSSQGFQIVLGRLMLWIHVREFKFMFSVLTAIVAFYIFVLWDYSNWEQGNLASKGEYQIDYLTAILLGYSVDSFFEPLWKRFSVNVSKQTQEIRKTLSEKILSEK
ncbi:hypothetical protein [Fodinibius sediminis]|nr:hypothetical protein [Fodinibius sediminis]